MFTQAFFKKVLFKTVLLCYAAREEIVYIDSGKKTDIKSPRDAGKVPGKKRSDNF